MIESIQSAQQENEPQLKSRRMSARLALLGLSAVLVGACSSSENAADNTESAGIYADIDAAEPAPRSGQSVAGDTGLDRLDPAVQASFEATDLTPWVQWGVAAEDVVTLRDLRIGDIVCSVNSERGSFREARLTGEATLYGDLADADGYTSVGDSTVIPTGDSGVALQDSLTPDDPNGFIFAGDYGLTPYPSVEDQAFWNETHRTFLGPCPLEQEEIFTERIDERV